MISMVLHIAPMDVTSSPIQALTNTIQSEFVSEKETKFEAIPYYLIGSGGNRVNLIAVKENVKTQTGKTLTEIWLSTKNVVDFLNSEGINASYVNNILSVSVPDGTDVNGSSIPNVPKGQAVLVVDGAVHKTFYVLGVHKFGEYMPYSILENILSMNGIRFTSVQTKLVGTLNPAEKVANLSVFSQYNRKTPTLTTVNVSALDTGGTPISAIKVQAIVNGTPLTAVTNSHGVATFQFGFPLNQDYLPIVFSTGNVQKAQILQSPYAPTSLSPVITMVNASANNKGQLNTEMVSNLLLYAQNQESINGFQSQITQSQNATQNSVSQSQSAVQNSVSSSQSAIQSSVGQSQAAVQSSITQAQNATTQAVSQGVQSVTDTVDEVGSSVQNSITQAQNAVQNSLNTGLASVAQFVQDGFNNVQSQVSSVASSAQTAAQAAQTAATLAKGTTVNIYQNAPILTVTAIQNGSTYTITGQLDQSGSPVANQTIQFTDAGAGGLFSPTTITTNSSGQFSVTYTPPASFTTNGGQITIVALGDGVTGSTTI